VDDDRGYGHYVAYAKSEEDMWIEYDDNHLYKAKFEDVQKSGAYMLFYMRKRCMLSKVK
jgi:ubiquitin C-terminal hydrolase